GPRRAPAFREVSCLARAPSAMKELLDRREEDLIREQADDNDHKHDRDDLIHRTQLATVVEKLAEAEAGKDRHKNFRCHEQAPWCQSYRETISNARLRVRVEVPRQVR